MYYDAQGLLWSAFEHPILAICILFGLYLALFHFAPALATSLGGKVYDFVTRFIAAIIDLVKNGRESPGKLTPAPGNNNKQGDGVSAALSDAQGLISFAVLSGDPALLTVATAILPELQKAAKEKQS